MCKKVLVISSLLGGPQSNLIAETLLAMNAGQVNRKGLKFLSPDQKGFEGMVEAQRPDYIFFEQTGKQTPKLLKRMNGSAEHAIVAYIGKDQVDGISEKHHFGDWRYVKLDELKK